VKAARGISVALLAACVVAVAAVSTYFVFNQGLNELAERDKLRDLGALVSMDGTGQYITSVNCSTISGDASLQEALRIIGKLRNISSLDLGRTSVTDADVSQIDDVNSLASLSLSECPITDAAIAHIAQLDNLISLYLSGTNVTDASLRQIASIDSLKILDLSGTSVHDELEPIGGMANLEWLVLSKLDLRAGALRNLHNAPSLTRVSLKEAKCEAADIEALQDSHPGITIDR
jgi:Leucine-rich repeat (LRR) protein